MFVTSLSHSQNPRLFVGQHLYYWSTSPCCSRIFPSDRRVRTTTVSSSWQTTKRSPHGTICLWPLRRDGRLCWALFSTQNHSFFCLWKKKTCGLGALDVLKFQMFFFWDWLSKGDVPKSVARLPQVEGEYFMVTEIPKNTKPKMEIATKASAGDSGSISTKEWHIWGLFGHGWEKAWLGLNHVEALIRIDPNSGVSAEESLNPIAQDTKMLSFTEARFGCSKVTESYHRISDVQFYGHFVHGKMMGKWWKMMIHIDKPCFCLGAFS